MVPSAREAFPETQRPLTRARARARPRDDLFGRDRTDGDLDSEFSKWINSKGQMPLVCHLYTCG